MKSASKRPNAFMGRRYRTNGLSVEFKINHIRDNVGRHFNHRHVRNNCRTRGFPVPQANFPGKHATRNLAGIVRRDVAGICRTTTVERTKFEVDRWLIVGVVLIAKACTGYLNRFNRFVLADKQRSRRSNKQNRPNFRRATSHHCARPDSR